MIWAKQQKAPSYGINLLVYNQFRILQMLIK